MPGAPLKPMLAMTGPLPAGAGWAYEFKWDGVRALADLSYGDHHLYARSGVEITTAYPELITLRDQVDDALLDGEVVLFNELGQPSFTALAERMHVRNPAKAARLAATVPVTYMIFDLLRLRGEDLTGRSYRERRAALESLGLGAARWAVPPTFGDGPATYEAAGEHGLEGVMAKRVDSVYRPGVRSPDWVKVKLEVTGDFVVGGWRPGARKIGGLLVGVPRKDGRLTYRGRVGGGIGAALEKELLRELEPLRTPASPFAGDVPREDARGASWVTPQIVVEVKYGQRTPDGRLRFPRILRLRPDKPPEEVDDAS
ncbi:MULTISPECIES: non-homologous end-joining DNA ligase [Micromonospora]|uniref:DNA ligase (ATP) n=1 Tax=Micromonospora sicca TaxID=2202420 RepID=A0A317DIQ0_9ACTN|nr:MULTISPECIES: non-homologous end-joining DNA ligase [unclassified Micromonospora]MBM0225252.1 non-homologous end-joining DNA ligase [Micromonospora sp. ATA51]MBM0225931.1 non-homologous end-joining DNA ligase [Micromonospora sp. ATA51]PWR14467.1 DNA ligase [Micromonospora sp. 4G51]